MKCSVCGFVNPSNQPVCPVCGANLKKRRSGKFIAIVMAVVLIIVAVGAVTVRPIYQYNTAEKLLDNGEIAKAAIAFGKLGDYQDARERSLDLWDSVAVRKKLDTGSATTVGLLSDGSVLAAGGLSTRWTPDSIDSPLVAVSAGQDYAMGLTANGNVVTNGQWNVSSWSDVVSVFAKSNVYAVGVHATGRVNITYSEQNDWASEIRRWNDIVAVCGTAYYIVGLKADGTVEVAVANKRALENAECVLEDWTDIIAISANSGITIGLKSNGTVVAAGNNEYGECDVESWKDIVAISAGEGYVVGLKSDGTVIATGNNEFGQCDVDNWTDIVAISTGSDHTVGLKFDGTVVAVGSNVSGQCGFINWTDVVDILYTGSEQIVGRKADGTIVTAVKPGSTFGVQGDWTDVIEVDSYIEKNTNIHYNTTRISNVLIGLKADGTVVSHNYTGGTDFGNWENIVQTGNIGEPKDKNIVGLRADGTVVINSSDKNLDHWTDIVKILCFENGNIIGLKSNGTMVSTGYKVDDLKNVVDIFKVGEESAYALKSNGTWEFIGPSHLKGSLNKWKNIVSVQWGSHLYEDYYVIGLKSDGNVVTYSSDSRYPIDLSEWTNIVSIATGYTGSNGEFCHVVGLKSDGTVVAWGNNKYGQIDVGDWTDITAVFAGNNYTVGFKSDGTAVIAGADFAGYEWQSNIKLST